MYLFTPPSVLERTGINHPLFGRIRLAQGVSLLKEGGLYRQQRNPSTEEITAADIAYLGGHVYWVSVAEAHSLDTAGYGDFVFQTGHEYGSGAYGEGPYGEGSGGAVEVDASAAYGLGPYGEGPYGGLEDG